MFWYPARVVFPKTPDASLPVAIEANPSLAATWSLPSFCLLYTSRRILEAKYKLGLFDNPYKYCDLKRPTRDIFTKAHRKAARRIAAESFLMDQ